MTPYKCLACDGWGKRTPEVAISSAFPAPVPCPACAGTGVIWYSAPSIPGMIYADTITSYPQTTIGLNPGEKV